MVLDPDAEEKKTAFADVQTRYAVADDHFGDANHLGKRPDGKCFRSESLDLKKV